jgi:hypothetical protein
LNYVDLEQEDWLFQGDVKADIQYRVYRDMRSACRKNWAKFTPKVSLIRPLDVLMFPYSLICLRELKP